MVTKFPKRVDVELSSFCNLTCPLCPHSFMKREQSNMDLKLVRKIANETRGKTEKIVLHNMGEPLLYPNLIRAINILSRSAYTILSTNCTLLKGELAKEIANSNLNEIILCLDSMIPERYEKIRKGASYNEVISNILSFVKLRKHKLKVIIQMINIPETIDEQNSFNDYWKDVNGVDKVVLKELSTFRGSIKVNVKKEKGICIRPFTEFIIHSKGDVVPCCIDYDGLEIMGNVNKNSIQEIWNSDKYDYFRKNSKSTNLCKNCQYEVDNELKLTNKEVKRVEKLFSQHNEKEDARNVIYFLMYKREWKPDVFLECGTGYGGFFIPLLEDKTIPKAIGIEPHPAYFDYTKKVVKRYGNRCELYNVALSDKEGEFDFVLDTKKLGDCHLKREGEITKYATRKVKTTLLDNIPIKGKALLWLDVQGHEGFLLKGAKKLLKTKPMVVIEYWPKGIERANSKKETFDFLKQCKEIYNIQYLDLQSNIPFEAFEKTYDEYLSTGKAKDLLCILK